MTPRQRQIRDCYRKYRSTVLAAEELGITPQRVRAVLVELEEPRDRAPLSYDEFVDEHLDEIVRRLEHESITSIAEDLGMVPATLSGHLAARGVLRPARYSEEERKIWERMARQKNPPMSCYDIAKARNVPRSTVDRHLRECNLVRDKATATRLALASDPNKRRGAQGSSNRRSQPLTRSAS